MSKVLGRVPTIMVVDDDDDVRLVTSEALRKEGCAVIEAANAAEAEVNALKQVPDLILMDLSMPGTDGLSALWSLRKHPDIANVPVVIVSAYDAFDLRAEAAAAGCRDYLIKLLTVQKLKDLVGSIVEARV
jgi:twitching motility two-component system response regulator PilG